jgi:hypothetical protein
MFLSGRDDGSLLRSGVLRTERCVPVWPLLPDDEFPARLLLTANVMTSSYGLNAKQKLVSFCSFARKIMEQSPTSNIIPKHAERYKYKSTQKTGSDVSTGS